MGKELQDTNRQLPVLVDGIFQIARKLASGNYGLVADICQMMNEEIMHLGDVNRHLALHIAKCRAIDVLRSRAYSHSYSGVIPHIYFNAISESVIDQELGHRSETDLAYSHPENEYTNKLEVERLLGMLSGEERGIISLWMDGFTELEIAAMYDKSCSTISKRLSRIFSKLRHKCE